MNFSLVRSCVALIASTIGIFSLACNDAETNSGQSTRGSAGLGGAPARVVTAAGGGGRAEGGSGNSPGGTGGMSLGGAGLGGIGGTTGESGAAGSGGFQGGNAGSGGLQGGNAGSGGAGGEMASVPSLGLAQTFAVLGGTTVTNTGATKVTGDLGVSSPGVSVTGFPPGTIAMGTIQIGTATPNQAQADAAVAYGLLAGEACTTPLTGMDLGGRTLEPGVYCFTSSASLGGKLTLDAKNNPNARFVFQIVTTLITATGSSVEVINSGKTSNVYWQVGTDATLGMGTAFRGTILAATSITMVSGSSLVGRALARAAVTLDSNVMSVP